MRPNNSSTPSLSLLHTSFQPLLHDNHPVYNDYSTAGASPPTSPLSLSSSSTIRSSSPTLPSSPTSPSLSPIPFKHIRNSRHVSDKLKLDHKHKHATSSPDGGSGNGVVLRRRPSNIDTVLRQERSRATFDSIERQGLDLLEPRPVDLDPVGNGIDARVQTTPTTMKWEGQHRLSYPSASPQAEAEASLSQPRFVMGGIFEVMEGSV